MAKNVDLAAGLDAELREYVTLRRRAELAESEAKEYKRQADEQRDRVWDLLDAAGVKTINHELGRITRTARLHALVTDEDALSSYLREAGLFDAMTKQSFRQKNLNGLVSDLIEGGESLPEGMDTLTIRGITFTPAK